MGLCSCPVLTQDTPISGLTITVTSISGSGTISLDLVNSSTRPIRIWQESDSWGAAHWRVLIVREGELHTFVQNPNQRFTINAPRFIVMAPGEYIRRELDINGGNWCDSDQCSRFDERGIGGKEISF